MGRINKYLFISIFLSSLLYAYYFISHRFEFRVASFITLLVFYLILFQILVKKIKDGSIFKLQGLPKLYLFTVIIILLFSIFNCNNEFITLFFHPFAFPGYLIGVVLFLVNSRSLEYLKVFFHQCVLLLPVITICDIVVFDYPISLVACYSIVMFDFIMNDKLKLYNALLLILSAYMFTLYDHRTGVIIVILFFLIYYLSKLFFIVRSKIFRFFIFVSSLCIIAFVFFNFSSVYNDFILFFDLTGVGSTDTRSFLFVEFFNDFKGTDYYLGRGYLGSYYSPYFQDWQGEGGDHSQRFVVEVGFLQILLKGGILLLLSFVLLFAFSMYQGFVKSKPNSVRFYIAIWLLIEFGMLAIENVPSFSIHYFVIWLLNYLLLSNLKLEKNLIVK